MLINLLQDKKNIITTNPELVSSLTNSGFSTKTSFDIKSWKISDPIDSASIIIKGITTSRLKDIKLSTIGPHKKFLIEYSNDFYNWTELPFIQTRPNDVFRLKQSINGSTYYYNITDHSTIQVDDDFEFEYAFTKFNPITKKKDYLYNKLEFVYLRITIYFSVIDYPSLVNPFHFDHLDIIIDEEFNDTKIEDILLTTVAKNFYKQKVFENQDFLPDMINTFCKMLQSNTNPDLSRNGNDSFFQLVHSGDFSSVEKLLQPEVLRDITFSPVEYNSVSKKYEAQDFVIEVSNNKKIRDALINQYLIEYKNFFSDVFNRDILRTQNSSVFSDENVTALLVFMLKNISKLNSLKGSQKLIEIIMGLYARFLGYDLISVVSGQDQNFVYRITTDIPTYFWKENIKHITHPCGWKAIYNYVDSVVNDIIIQHSPEKENAISSVRDTYNIQNKLITNINTNDNTGQYNMASIANFGTGHAENSVGRSNNQVYNFEIDPTALSTFVNEIDKTDSVSITNLGSNRYKLKFNKPSFAFLYEWKIYQNGSLINTIATEENTVILSVTNSTQYSLTLHFNILKYTLVNAIPNIN